MVHTEFEKLKTDTIDRTVIKLRVYVALESTGKSNAHNVGYYTVAKMQLKIIIKNKL